jgi:hypothetical protein
VGIVVRRRDVLVLFLTGQKSMLVCTTLWVRAAGTYSRGRTYIDFLYFFHLFKNRTSTSSLQMVLKSQRKTPSVRIELSMDLRYIHYFELIVFLVLNKNVSQFIFLQIISELFLRIIHLKRLVFYTASLI